LLQPLKAGDPTSIELGVGVLRFRDDRERVAVGVGAKDPLGAFDDAARTRTRRTCREEERGEGDQQADADEPMVTVAHRAH
jgi:hypothetical protein